MHTFSSAFALHMTVRDGMSIPTNFRKTGELFHLSNREGPATGDSERVVLLWPHGRVAA